MRVLHVIPSLDKQDGGTTIALQTMARSLVAQGVHIEIATTLDATQATQQKITFEAPVEIDGFTVRYFRRQTNFYKVSLHLRAWLEKHAREYDLIHIHALFSFSTVAAARAARRSRTSYVISPHGMLNTWGMRHRRPGIKAASFYLLEKSLLNQASVIHFTSDQEHDDAKRLDIKTACRVIPLGFDLAPFQHHSAPELFYQHFPETRGKSIILFLSRLDPVKNVELLMEAYASLDECIHLVIAGSGSPDYLETLQTKARQWGIQTRITWAGHLDGDLKLSSYAAAKIFVLPSQSESFGVALLEAMAAGLACVSTAAVALATGNSDVIRVTDATPYAFKTALQHLLQAPESAKALGQEARDRAFSRYGMNTTGLQLASLYKTFGTVPPNL